MKKIAPLAFALVLASSCAVGYGHRGGGVDVVAAADFDGTVTFIDVAGHRMDLDYIEGGRHYTRNVYYDDAGTRWNGVRYDQVRIGDHIAVHGHRDHDRWRAEEVRRRD